MGAGAGYAATQAQVAAQQQLQQKNDILAQAEALRPSFQSPLQNGQLGSQYRLEASMGDAKGLQNRLDDIQLDKRGLNAFRERALAQPGTSAWEQMMLARQGTEQTQARENAMAQGAQAAAQARAAMAMKGGLSGGAAERLSRDQAMMGLRANQGIARSGEQARQGIGLDAENQRLQALGALPGMEVQALQPDLQKTGMWQQMNQFNAQQQNTANQANQQATLLAMANANKNATDVYGQQMSGIAAGRQATAVENSGKK